jgi:hypothetical protein
VQRWIIVYPAGDRSKLTVALAWSYEEDEYDMASRRSWAYDEESEAIEYAADLAKRNNLMFRGQRGQAYLD